MIRTPDDDWKDVAYRLKQANRSSDGEARMLARRRRQEQKILMAVFGLSGLLLVLMVVFVVGVAKSFGNKTDAPVAMAPRVTPTATVLPTIPPEYMHPFRILLLGSDQREDDPGYRTDVVVLVTIDPSGPTASAVSFPRDLWVEPAGYGGMKINMVKALGGFEALQSMFENSYGVRPDYYVMVNFEGFTRLIDYLGGIDVNAEAALTDRCDLPQAVNGDCTVLPGVTHMNGATALWYARSRHTSSDYDRLRRAQEVVQGVFDRMVSLDALGRLPEFYRLYTENLETNVSLTDIAPLAPAGIRLFQEPDRIHRYVITEEHATPSWSYDGMWILLPNYDAIHAVLEEAGALNGQ